MEGPCHETEDGFARETSRGHVTFFARSSGTHRDVDAPVRLGPTRSGELDLRGHRTNSNRKGSRPADHQGVRSAVHKESLNCRYL